MREAGRGCDRQVQRPMSVSAKLDRGETVCSHARLLFYQTASARWCAPFPPVVLGRKSFAVSTCPGSDWLMLVELNFLPRIYTFRRARPRPESHPLCHWPVPLIVLIVRLTGS